LFSLIRIAQDLIGMIHRGTLNGRISLHNIGFVGMSIGVKLERKFAIGLFNFRLGRCLRYPKHLVVILFYILGFRQWHF
jgi:hypothetical protein